MIYSLLGHTFCKRYHIRSFVPVENGEMLMFTHNKRANHAIITGRGPYQVEFWQLKRYGQYHVKTYADVIDLPEVLAKFARFDNASQETYVTNNNSS